MHLDVSRGWTGVGPTAVVAWLLIASSPAVAPAEGHAGGTTDSLRNQTDVSDGRKPGPRQAGPGTESALAGPWDPEAVTLTPWCALDADSLRQQCDGSRHVCGEVTVPCDADLPGGLELVAAGTGLRSSPSGTIQLRGARPGSTPVVAWLYWAVIVRPGVPVLPGNEIRFGEVELGAEELGTSEEPCWSPELPGDDGVAAVLRAYWMEVTPYLLPQINGDYRVVLTGSSLTNGQDPWGPVPSDGSGFEAEGASLIVVVSHPDVAPQSMVAVHVGPSLLIGSEEYHHELSIPVPAAGQARHYRIGGDGQGRTERHPVAAFRTLFSPFDGQWIPLRGEGSTIDPHADWQGADGGPVTQLWDTQMTASSTALLGLILGLTSYRMGYDTPVPPVPEGPDFRLDCVNVLAHILWVGD